MNRRTVLALAGLNGIFGESAVRASNATPTADGTNEDLARDYIARVWDQGDSTAIDELIAENYVPADSGDAEGRDAFRARWERGRASLLQLVPDARYSVDATISSHELVALRGRIAGTTTGGERFEHWYLSMLAVRDGVITTEWALVSS